MSEFAFKNVRVDLNGRFITTLQDIKYGMTTEQEVNRGTGGAILSIESGDDNFSVMIGINQSEAEALIQASKESGFRYITHMSFDVTVSYAKLLTDPQVTDVIKGVKIESLEKALTQNDKKMKVELPGIAQEIEFGV